MKRFFDISVILIFSPLLLALFALLAISVWIHTSGSIFFKQKRKGRYGKEFHIWKFRTMRDGADELLENHLQGNKRLQHEWRQKRKLKEDPRVTRLGRMLRVTSLDELPQIWNVWKGEMSLVGPRPIVDEEISLYGENYKYYIKVLPGITGLWQVSGRNNTTYKARVKYDVFYVEHRSFRMDIWILFRTIKVILTCEGAY